MHDADRRLGVFVARMKREKVDFIVQLGDFCRPIAANDGFLRIWQTFNGPRYHVLGNHDMDGGFTREQTVACWGMPARHYSFDAGGYHFIALDGNDKTEPPQPGYARYIGDEQQQWLRRELAGTRLPTIVFSHQSLEAEGGIANGEVIRRILDEANRAAGGGKVLACFSGHHHMDYCRQINSIQYIQINSMSYFWMGSEYQHVRYGPQIDRDYPWIKYTAPYAQPLFALVTLAPDGTITIEGTQSKWVGPTPWDVGYPQDHRERITPGVSNRRLQTALKQPSASAN
jgi:3',5'-cyclic AMP phosphodiesterase CpdA